MSHVPVSRETSERLDILCTMVERWNRAINLVAAATIAQLRHRHIADSTQLVAFLPNKAQHWVDLGSGAGFPGLVIAAQLVEFAPDCRVTLIESDQRKAVFLREASRAMAIQTNVITGRIENTPHQQADVISARALAPLTHLLYLTSLHLKTHGTAIFLKGQEMASEVRVAAKDGWKFESTQHKSATDPGGAIVIVRNMTREHSK